MSVRSLSSAAVPRPSPRQAEAASPAVELIDATASLGGRTVWSGVNLTVDPGEFVAVIGPNGAGKSTLVKVLLGLLPLAGGQARVLGRAPGEASDRIESAVRKTLQEGKGLTRDLGGEGSTATITQRIIANL